LRSCQTGSWCKFQKNSDSDEEEKEEEEREEEEEEVAAALDNKDVSCEQVDTYVLLLICKWTLFANEYQT
jgi:hypothetical protein